MNFNPRPADRRLRLAGVLLGVVWVGAASAGELRLECRWADPVSGAAMEFVFPGPPLLACSPGAEVTVREASAGEVRFAAPNEPGPHFFRLNTVPETPLICLFVPLEGTLDRKGYGNLTVDGVNLGYYGDSAKGGQDKVKEHPEAYVPPRWFWRILPETADFWVSPSMRLQDLVVPSKDTGERHTDLVPVCYPLLKAIETLRGALAGQRIPSGAFKILSVFRAPGYNRGIGSTRYGRHVYCDAVDFIVDADNNEDMDDLNRDGKVDSGDGLWLVAMIEDLQASGALPMGGIGVYCFSGGDYSCTMHLDLRGHRATWAFAHDSRGRKNPFAWQSRRFAELDAAEEAERARQGKETWPKSRTPLPAPNPASN